MTLTPARRRRYAFRFDASACAGCKACQIACKDKHDLEVGRLWRRVYDVTGGGWRRDGDAWRSEVFAFHLSIGCNHCAKPICVEGCPSRALERREDGIVTLDVERCLGCRYCEWSCPYGAPQYDRARGQMTKCTFCVDELDAGRKPICVTACPLRVLELEVIEEGAPPLEPGERQDPLPDPRLTEPALLFEEHRDGARARREAVEVIPRKRYELHEWSLVVFTLLVHLAAGTVLWSFALRLVDSEAVAPRAAWWAAAIATAAALLFSLRHLGSPRRAPRAIANLPGSPLSQEILTALLFLAFCAAALLFEPLGSSPIALGVAGLLALRLVQVTSRVYRLRTVPTWRSAWTFYSFFTTTLLLGVLTVLAYRLGRGGVAQEQPWLLYAALLLVAWRRQVVIVHYIRLGAESIAITHRPLWVPLALGLVAAFLLLSAMLAATEQAAGWLDLALLAPAITALLAAEVIDRHAFFASYLRSGV